MKTLVLLALALMPALAFADGRIYRFSNSQFAHYEMGSDGKPCAVIYGVGTITKELDGVISKTGEVQMFVAFAFDTEAARDNFKAEYYREGLRGNGLEEVKTVDAGYAVKLRSGWLDEVARCSR